MNCCVIVHPTIPHINEIYIIRHFLNYFILLNHVKLLSHVLLKQSKNQICMMIVLIEYVCIENIRNIFYVTMHVALAIKTYKFSQSLFVLQLNKYENF